MIRIPVRSQELDKLDSRRTLWLVNEGEKKLTRDLGGV